MLTAAAQAIESGAGVDRGESCLRRFFLTVGDYFRIPQREVTVIKERGFSPNEVPVVLFLAKKAHVAPEVIMDLRLSGYTWLDITIRFGLSSEIFNVPIGVMVIDPPCRKVYGYFKKTPQKDWKTIVLSDEDITNLVNLKFMSEPYRYPPEKIIGMWSGGKELISINEEIRKERKREMEKDESKVEKGRANRSLATGQNKKEGF